MKENENTFCNRCRFSDFLSSYKTKQNGRTVRIFLFSSTKRRYCTSFSGDLCLESSQWLIGEVFTAFARMEHSLIVQLQITVMFLSDASELAFFIEEVSATLCLGDISILFIAALNLLPVHCLIDNYLFVGFYAVLER